MPEEITEYLKAGYPFWDKLSMEDKEKFSSGSRIQEYKGGTLLGSGSGECLGILLLRKGSLRVYIQSAEGREITLFRVVQGEVCTLSASCAMHEITFDILLETIGDSEVLVTKIACFRRLMEENIYVENYTYKQITKRFSEVMWAMDQILFASFDKRLAGYLLNECQKHKSMALNVTHEQIAKQLGSAREVVSRMLKYFEREGIVSLRRGMVTVLDQETLKQLF